MERWVGKVAVVTGASAGIGKCIALSLSKLGMVVVGLARNTDRLKELVKDSSGKIHVMKCDISVEADIVACFDEIGKLFGGVDVLVNNAGYLNLSSVMEGSTAEWRKTFDTNVLGMSICSKEALKTMRIKNPTGQIFNINSTSGHVVDNIYKSDIGMYSPSKFAVTALTETLRRELRANGSRINVTSISPGWVYTKMATSVIHNVKDLNFKDTGSLASGFLDPQDIADAIVCVLGMNPRVEIQELTIESNESIVSSE